MSRLAGKSALITGGSRGIGAAIASAFAAEGANIVFTYVGDTEAAQQTLSTLRARGVTAEAVQAHGGDPQSARVVIDRAVATLGGLDILVHNAGVANYVAIDAVDDEAYDDLERQHFAVNVSGVVRLTKAAVPHLRDNGRIIMIGSVNAHQMPFPGTAIYGASKAAVAALGRGWARDFGERGILVNVIQPGPIATGMNPEDDRPVVRVMSDMTALKRYGRPHEIAALATFLASDESSYITGTAIDIDGGFSI